MTQMDSTFEWQYHNYQWKETPTKVWEEEPKKLALPNILGVKAKDFWKKKLTP